MRILIRVLEIMPAVLFGLIGLYYASRILVGHYPSEPFAWELFAKLTPVGREIGVVVSHLGLVSAYTACVTFLLLAIAVGYVFQSGRHRRWQFISAHLALLSIFVGARDENVFTASMDFVLGAGTSIMPNFAALQIVHAILLVGVFYVCVNCHRRIVWGLLNPVRSI